jgi:hypothetical protein
LQDFIHPVSVALVVAKVGIGQQKRSFDCIIDDETHNRAMAINAPSGSNEHYGALTQWTREIPVLSTLGWATHKVRNGVSNVLGSKTIEKGMNAVI